MKYQWNFILHSHTMLVEHVGWWTVLYFWWDIYKNHILVLCSCSLKTCFLFYSFVELVLFYCLLNFFSFFTNKYAHSRNCNSLLNNILFGESKNNFAMERKCTFSLEIWHTNIISYCFTILTDNHFLPLFWLISVGQAEPLILRTFQMGIVLHLWKGFPFTVWSSIFLPYG